ncbi:MAG TPA: DUF3108 domain-containing protein [Pyrinomonadaceae bacterium]|nr:DUF3108 domain-containing protein [Pyrinomonadaceae bacterium]
MRTLKTIKLILFLVVAVASANAQKATPKPFEPLEELHFEAEFSRALLRKLDVADLKFHASSTPADDESYTLTFKADITSKGFFARLFNLKFRERVESTVEPITFTVEKTTILDEQGKRVRATESTFDRSQGKMTWTLRDPNNPTSEPRRATAEFSGQLQDVLSAIYFIRTKPLAVGKTFDVFIGDGGRVYTIPVKVVEKKRMKTVVGRVDAFHVVAELFGPERLIDHEKGEFSMWVTDDARRIPVRGRVKTDYGTFDIKLKRVITSPPAVK